MEEITNENMDIWLCKKLKLEHNKNKTKMPIITFLYVYSVSNNGKYSKSSFNVVNMFLKTPTLGRMTYDKTNFTTV